MLAGPRGPDALTGIDDHTGVLAVQAVSHAAGQTWLSDSSIADPARLLTTLVGCLNYQGLCDTQGKHARPVTRL